MNYYASGIGQWIICSILLIIVPIMTTRLLKRKSTGLKSYEKSKTLLISSGNSEYAGHHHENLHSLGTNSPNQMTGFE